MVFMDPEDNPYDHYHIYNATDDWEEYQNGKSVECVCGQGIGVDHSTEAVKCASCNRLVVDREAESRGEDVQMDLTQF